MIIRTNKTAGNYTPIHNHSLTDPRLSLRARGLLAYLLAKPDNWVTQTKNIQDWHQDAGRETILSALRELETTGYLKRRCTNNPLTGKLEWERVIYESPQGDSLIEMSIAIENIKAGNPHLPRANGKERHHRKRVCRLRSNRLRSNRLRSNRLRSNRLRQTRH